MSPQSSHDSSRSDPARGARPDLTLVMPCYNEQEIVEYTINRLLGAFRRAGYRLELIAVDNGSRDRTGEIIQSLAAQDPGIVPHRVEVNQGYGYGVLSGLPLGTATWIGIIPADGQVDAEDVVRLYEAVVSARSWVLGKVRRRFRMDGLRRKFISTGYNLFVLALWPRLGSLDVNGSPKIFPRQALELMDLKSTGWFLDPEIMIKAHYLGIRVLEFNTFARLRGSGVSHVRSSTVWEFLRSLLHYRFSDELPRWRQSLREGHMGDQNGPAHVLSAVDPSTIPAGKDASQP
jgi:glycosyltransferase involved in cell wall biosynthesis